MGWTVWPPLRAASMIAGQPVADPGMRTRSVQEPLVITLDIDRDGQAQAPALLGRSGSSGAALTAVMGHDLRNQNCASADEGRPEFW